MGKTLLYYMWTCSVCHGGPWNHKYTPACLSCGHQRNQTYDKHEPVYTYGRPTSGSASKPKRQRAPIQNPPSPRPQASARPKPDPPIKEPKTTLGDSGRDFVVDDRVSNVELFLRRLVQPIKSLLPQGATSVLVKTVQNATRPRIPAGHKRIEWICVSSDRVPCVDVILN